MLRVGGGLTSYELPKTNLTLGQNWVRKACRSQVSPYGSLGEGTRLKGFEPPSPDYGSQLQPVTCQSYRLFRVLNMCYLGIRIA